MKYTYLTVHYKNKELEYIKTNNNSILEKLGNTSDVIKAQPEELSKNNILDWVTTELSYEGFKIISHSENIYRIPDVATKTVHTFILDE